MSAAMDAFRRWAKDKTLTDVLKRSHGDTFVAGWEEGEAERARLRDALEELVALKPLKDTEGKTADYEQRQPLAWQAAREALRETAK
ncbi:MAG TPA: hypothetical protein VNM48_10640 [Chloroflexota bacterium]|nr:hypothetical protein [Chloroflexota bacterium]